MPPHKTSYVTQKDIARLANVSQSAVAAALGRTDKIRVSEETRAKVLKAAAQLNYSPNQSASVTRSGRTRQVALIASGTRSHGVFTRLQHLAIKLHEQGLRVVTHELQWSNRSLEEAWDEALASRVEGIVLSSSFGTIHAPMHKRLLNSPVPVVSLCGPFLPGIPLVAPDYRKAFRELTAALIAGGKRNLVMLKRFRRQDAIVQIAWKGGERMEGFLEAVRESNLERECKVIEVYNRQPEIPKNEYQLGELGLADILEQSGGEIPDGIICGNDNFAQGVLTAARRLGISIPSQVCVTGCDGEQWAEFGSLPMTTIAQPSEMLADRAAEILIGLLQGETQEQEQVLLPCEIHWRDSCPLPVAKVTAC